LAYGQTCTSTLSAGAAVGTAITNATAGDVICLNNGNYSGFTLNNVSKNPRVTVRAVNAGSATFTSGIIFSGSTSGMTFDGVNYSGIYVGQATGDTTKDLTFMNGDASPGGIEVDFQDATAPNLLFENLTLYDQDDGNYCTASTINCMGKAAGVTVLNSPPYRSNLNPVVILRGLDINRGCADGIKMDVPGIVEYSTIQNRQLGVCSGDPHIDAFQNVGGNPGIIFRYNYVYNNQQSVSFYDEATEALIEHNVVDVGSGGRQWAIELYSDDSSIVRNNTVIVRGSLGSIALDRKASGQDNGFGTQVYNNIALQLEINNSAADVNTNNLFVNGGGAGNITGSPTFEGTCQGGAANWRNCALANGSAGKNAGTDGKDVGTHYFGVRKPTGMN
jgi:hypothetical protein